MAIVFLKKGGSFFGHIKEYDWKGKFLVVARDEIIIDNKHELRIVSWDNVERVYNSEYKKVTK